MLNFQILTYAYLENNIFNKIENSNKIILAPEFKIYADLEDHVLALLMSRVSLVYFSFQKKRRVANGQPENANSVTIKMTTSIGRTRKVFIFNLSNNRYTMTSFIFE